MINRELMELRSDEMAMEYLHDIAMDLPAIERSQYVNIVTEAMISNPDTQLKIINKLAKQVEGLQEVDLDQCRKSMGNITKYPYYDAMAKAIDIINDSEVTSDLPNVIRMNKVHNILLDNADDFIWGYKHNDMVVMKVYIIMTRLLFIMIDLSISDYVKALEINFKFNSKLDKVPAKISKVINDTDNMIKMFENGKWRAIVSNAKSAATSRSMKALDEMESTEPPKSMANEATIGIKIPTNTKEVVDAYTDMVAWVKGTKAGKVTGVILAIITIMIIYRDIAFYVAALGGKFANCIRHCAEIIKAHENVNRNQSASAVEKQNGLYNLLVGTADRIDAFFTKASREAEAKVKKANQEDFNTNEITQIEGIDFGL